MSTTWPRRDRRTVVFEASTVRIRAYRCRGGRFGPALPCVARWDSVVFVRSGGFAVRGARNDQAVDPNRALVMPEGREYLLQAPSPFDDRVTEIELHPDFAVALAEASARRRQRHERAPSRRTLSADRPPRLDWTDADVPAAAYALHIGLLRGALDGRLDPLALEERACRLVADMIEGRHDDGAAPRGRRPSERTRRAHAELAHATQAHLAARFRSRLSFASIADAVESSPAHLARVFRRHVGTSIHRYVDRLRLRTALAQLLDHRTDLTTLALASGYSSHAHFTAAFRREFGFVPSRAAEAITAEQRRCDGPRLR